MRTPTDWYKPVFLMNFPLTVSNNVPNNVLMDPGIQGPYDQAKAGEQWLSLYEFVTKEALVYILPGQGNFQDLPFVANLGAYLPHIYDRDVILLSNFTSPPRIGEEMIGHDFFKSFGYEVHFSPYKWEGEADLKWIRNNVYVGALGSRSTQEAYDWMHQSFDMNVTTIEITDPKLYHLDGVFFPLDRENALVNVSVVKPKDLKKLEALVNIIEVPAFYRHEGWTNVVRLNNTILHSPDVFSYKPFEVVLENYDYELKIFNLKEFDKSGADLSCLLMHLNMHNRA